MTRAIIPQSQPAGAVPCTRLPIIHTREGHLPDLSDCPPNKLEEADWAEPRSAVRAYGQNSIRGEYGHAIVESWS